MKTLSDRYFDELYIDINKPNVSEGIIDWLKRLFTRSTKMQVSMKKRFGKLPIKPVKNIKELQATKNIEGKIEKDNVNALKELGFDLLYKMFKNKKEYFFTNGKEVDCETVTYVYTPKNAIGKDEKYIVCVAIKNKKDIQVVKGYEHIIDFEITSEVDVSGNIINDLFEIYINTVVKKNSPKAKGVTVRYVNSEKDFILKYNNKSFTIEDEEKKLMKLNFE